MRWYFLYRRYPNQKANLYEGISAICRIMIVPALVFTWIGFMAMRDGDSIGIFVTIGGALAVAVFIALAIVFRKKANHIMDVEGARPSEKPGKEQLGVSVIILIIGIVLLFVAKQIH